MSQRTVVRLIDDLDGSEATETVTFGLDGASYEIDLNEGNALDMRAALAAFVEAARGAGGSSGTPGRSTQTATVDAGAVRAWARTQGIRVSARGRVPAVVVERYRDAGH